MKKLLTLILLVVLLSTFAGIATYAWFTSSASSIENIFQAGTLAIRGTESVTPLFSKSQNGEWYPGREFIGVRNLNVKNEGSLKARIDGISAVARFYIFNADNTKFYFSHEDISAASFSENLIITVKNPIAEDDQGSTIYRIIYTGPLNELMEDGYKTFATDIILEPNGSSSGTNTSLIFNVKMSEAAGNEIQGVSADVDLVIHATQENATRN